MKQIDYKKLQRDMMKISKFWDNKERIEKAFLNNDLTFITQFKNMLEQEQEQEQADDFYFLQNYYKLKYFPDYFELSREEIKDSFNQFFKKQVDMDLEDVLPSSYLFFDEFYTTLEDNHIEIDSLFQQSIREKYNSDSLYHGLYQGSISFADINLELFEDDLFDNDDVIRSCRYLVENQLEDHLRFLDRKYYILKYYINQYGIDEGIEKMYSKKIKNEDSRVGYNDVILKSITNVDDFCDFYQRFSLLFTKKEFKGLLNKVCSIKPRGGLFPVRGYYGSYDNLKDVCYMLDSLGYGDYQMQFYSFLIYSSDDLVPIKQVIEADKFYTSIVDQIREYDFSPLEAYTYIYLLSKNYKHFKYYHNSIEDDKRFRHYSRNPYLILDNDWEVCTGYVMMADLLLKRLGFISKDVLVTNDNVSHARLGVFIDDHKYHVKSAFLGDPTFDSRSYGIYNIRHMLMKFEEVSSDHFVMEDFQFNLIRGLDNKNLPYQEINREVLDEVVHNVIYKVLDDLSLEEKDNIIKEIVSSVFEDKNTYDSFDYVTTSLDNECYFVDRFIPGEESMFFDSFKSDSIWDKYGDNNSISTENLINFHDDLLKFTEDSNDNSYLINSNSFVKKRKG